MSIGHPYDTATNVYADEIEALNREYAVVITGSSVNIMRETWDPTFNRPDIALLKAGDFKTLLANRKVPNPVRGSGRKKMVGIAEVWIESEKRRQYEGIIFDPSGKETDARYWNLYRGRPFEPREGDWSKMRYHIEEVVAGGEERSAEYILNWMAYKVPNQGIKRPFTSLVLKGEQGAGKGVFATKFGACFGNHFLHIRNMEQLAGKHNAHQKDALLLFLDEARWSRNEKHAGIVRGLITEDTNIIEPKFKDAFRVKNHVSLIIASDADWLIPAGLKERRFFVVNVSSKHRRDNEYFNALCIQMDKGGCEAMLHDLLKQDIRGFDPRVFPRTEALLDQIIMTMGDVEAFYFDLLSKAEMIEVLNDDAKSFKPFQEGDVINRNQWDGSQEVNKSGFYEAYRLFCRNNRGRFDCVPDFIFWKKMKALCPSMMDIRRRDDDGHRWRIVSFPGISDCRKDFEKIVDIADFNWDPVG